MALRIAVLLLVSFVPALLGSPRAQTRPGPHGGEVQRAEGVISGRLLELVVKSGPGGKEIHVYGLDQNHQPVSLAQSGYGGIVFRLDDLELPLACHKVDDGGLITNAPESIQHYFAVGKFPSHARLELAVTVAFPSKQGTGKAVFHPFASRSNVPAP